MSTGPKSAIWWIRRDLRLHDNPALRAALDSAEQVLPVFVLDDRLLRSPYVGDKRLSFLFAGLKALDRDLRRAGSYLLLRQGRPFEVLSGLTAGLRIGQIFAEEDYSPFARRRDGQVATELPLKLVTGLTARHPTEIRKSSGEPYTVYTPFSKAWKSLPALGAGLAPPERIRSPRDLEGLRIPELASPPVDSLFPAGEVEGLRRLTAFTEGEAAPIFRYGDRRDRLDLEGTSALSPYFRFGMVSARTAFRAAFDGIERAPDAAATRGAETWLNELIWREFFHAILYHFPIVRRQSFRENLRGLRWENDEDLFEDWCRGRTGYPVVDAAMRQLQSSGWMHNRARMIVASFLTKDLLIDWRWGEWWFMQNLVDGDLAANNGGWQWTAGTGTDAAPYFRIFNPVLQSRKFDPAGEYIRRWVPEIRELDDKFIHTPWEAPAEIQKQAAVQIGQDYPFPVIDHAWARERTLEAYRAAREEPGNEPQGAQRSSLAGLWSRWNIGAGAGMDN